MQRIQFNGSAVQLKGVVKPAEAGCHESRQNYIFGISRLERNRPLEGSIRSSPIVVNLLLNPSHLGMGHGQFRLDHQGSLNRFTRTSVTLYHSDYTLLG